MSTDPYGDDYVPPDQPMNGWNREEAAEIERARLAVVPEGGGMFANFCRGGGFVLDAPDHVPAVWGHGNDVVWAKGEALMICGPSGVGKTTISAQLVAGRLGLQRSVMGLPVAAGERNVLYLAMDRPQQAARAFRRRFTEEHRELLDERLIVWKGPPPFDMAKHPDLLVRMCEQADADTVFVDSVKDAAIGLSEDEVGAGYNRARQKAITAGVEVVENHHQRKTGTNGGTPKTISDVYGSVWLPNGAGSVVVLWGDPGDSIVEFIHLKQPAEPVGPFKIMHDHDSGLTSVQTDNDPLVIVRANPYGISVQGVAAAMFDARSPKANQVEAARRKLKSLVKAGLVVEDEGQRGGGEARRPALFRPAPPRDLLNGQDD